VSSLSKLPCDPGKISSQFGLSYEEFDRYFALGLIKIAIRTSASGSEGEKRIQCHFGNRVWSAEIDCGGSIIWDEIRFLRGKYADSEQ
jgi:hypothetical protein